MLVFSASAAVGTTLRCSMMPRMPSCTQTNWKPLGFALSDNKTALLPLQLGVPNENLQPQLQQGPRQQPRSAYR